ncbi:MAG: hypothetical protein KAU50_05210 [Candidatus Marinimicrobia bacterium]|nr:hypothetical protein [Candidatus Neomarinimicrobiota bacterium]
MAQLEEKKIEGAIVQGTYLGFQSLNEDWNTYKLEDGTKLKIKTIVTKVFRSEGSFNQEGDPIYHVQSTNIVTTEVPPELKQVDI